MKFLRTAPKLAVERGVERTLSENGKRLAQGYRLKLLLFGFVSEPDGLGIIFQRPLHVAFLKACIAPSVVCEHKAGLESGGLGVILQRSFHVAFLEARFASAVVGIGIVGIEPDGLGIIFQRVLHVAFLEARVAPVVVGDGIVGFEPDGLEGRYYWTRR